MRVLFSFGHSRLWPHDHAAGSDRNFLGGPSQQQRGSHQHLGSAVEWRPEPRQLGARPDAVRLGNAESVRTGWPYHCDRVGCPYDYREHDGTADAVDSRGHGCRWLDRILRRADFQLQRSRPSDDHQSGPGPGLVWTRHDRLGAIDRVDDRPGSDSTVKRSRGQRYLGRTCTHDLNVAKRRAAVEWVSAAPILRSPDIAPRCHRDTIWHAIGCSDHWAGDRDRNPGFSDDHSRGERLADVCSADDHRCNHWLQRAANSGQCHRSGHRARADDSCRPFIGR